MFEALATVVDEAEIPADPAALREVICIRDRLEARVATAIGQCEVAGLYELDSDVTMQSWLRRQTGREDTDAARLANAGPQARQPAGHRRRLPIGRLGAEQVEIILANVRLRHLDLFGGHEANLVPVLEVLGVDELRAATGDWARAGATKPMPAARPRGPAS